MPTLSTSGTAGPYIFFDRVRETSTTTGTATYALGGAVASYQAFSTIGDGNSCFYAAVDRTNNGWEVGAGTFTLSGATLSRDTILASSNSGSAVSWAAGTRDIFLDITAWLASRVPNSLFDHFATVGNTTTTETDLYSDTIPIGIFSQNGDKVEAEYGGKFVSSGTATREVRVYFAGTAILDTGALTLSLSSAWTCYVTLIRVSATVARYMVSFATEGAALAAYTAVGELTGLTLVGSNVLKVTGQAAGVGAASSDITIMLGSVWRSPMA